MSAAMCSHYNGFSSSEKVGNSSGGASGDPGEEPLEQLFSDPFVEATTDCRCFEELIDEAPWVIDNLSDLFKVPCEDWDDYIDRRTEFGTWTEMLSAADVLSER